MRGGLKLMLLAAIVSGWLAADGPTGTSFSGTWEINKAGSDTGRAPSMLVIRQTPSEVRVTATLRGKTEELVYWLGNEPTQMENKDAGVIRGSAHLKGSQLTLETPRKVNGMSVTLSEVLVMDPSGDKITIDRMLLVHHGYSGVADTDYPRTREFYTRKAR